MQKKHIMYALLPLFVLTMAAAGTTYAAAASNAEQKPFTAIAEAIARKFNLTTADVQKVIDETRPAERAQMRKNHQERLNPLVQAVKDGKLTQAQADLITAKREEMKKSAESFKAMTEPERAAAMKAHREEMNAWAKENNIPEQFVMPMGKFGNGHVPGKKGMGCTKEDSTTETAE